MHESTQICIKHCQNGRMINTTHVDYLNAGMMCKLYVTFISGGWGYFYTANFQWHSKSYYYPTFCKSVRIPLSFSCENTCVAFLYFGDHVLVAALWVKTACLLRYLQNLKNNILNTYTQQI